MDVMYVCFNVCVAADGSLLSPSQMLDIESEYEIL